jgi:hypothetical protein
MKKCSMTMWGLLALSLAATGAHAGPLAGIPSPSASTSASATPSFSARELDAAIARLGDADVTIRRAAAYAIVHTPGDALPLLEIRMLRAPEAGPGPMWLALDKARKSLGSSKEGIKDGKEESPTELLAAVVDSGNGPGARSLALLLAGMQACETQGGVAGARVLVHLAVENKGLLKTTVTNALRRMGDHAVAALVEVRRAEDKDLRTWANRTLDSLGKFLPSDAVQVKDPQALADVLVAFGKIKDPDAMRVIITYLDADRAQVREAARWAIAQFGNDAKAPLKEAYDNFTGDKAGDDWPAEKTLGALVAAYDKVRLAEVYKLLDEGLAHRDAGRLEDAVASFDALLARAPTFERKAELAPTYVDLAHKKLPSDRAAGRALLAKALRLAAGTNLAPTIESELDYLDAAELLEHGVADTTLLERALQLDPHDTAARDLLTRLQNDAEARESRLRRWAASGAVGIVAALAAILFLGRKTKKPPSRTTPQRPVRI